MLRSATVSCAPNAKALKEALTRYLLATKERSAQCADLGPRRSKPSSRDTQAEGENVRLPVACLDGPCYRLAGCPADVVEKKRKEAFRRPLWHQVLISATHKIEEREVHQL